MTQCSKFSVRTYITDILAIKAFAKTHTKVEVEDVFAGINETITQYCPQYLEVVEELKLEVLEKYD